ncbi:hypothetical protein ABID08_003997 [Rhizobium binae]|uniref:Uncharacterized protein n=1 Tax=Rhizobium binae TaxID=1138190 RepID=A0ABV2MKE7_9HYPH
MTVCGYMPTSAYWGRAKVTVDVAEQRGWRTEAAPVCDCCALARLPICIAFS